MVKDNTRYLIVSKNIYFKIKDSFKKEDIMLLNEEDYPFLMDLYFTYEFSNNIFYLSDENPVCASLLNFVNLGLITLKEAIDSLIK